MNSKRIAGLAVLLVIVVSAIFYLKPKGNATPPLKLCTWSNYYPDEVLEAFQKDTGIPLEISYISSNEELLAKFKAGATDYDIIQPSDYMVRQMHRLGMLAELDHAKLPGLSHIDEFYKNLPYDPGLKFSVPFTWGTTGIAVNSAKVQIPETGASWALIFESPDFKHTSLLDDMREDFGAALLWKGKSLNTTDLKALTSAREDLQAIKAKILMFSSEARPLLVKGEVNIAHVYSSDAVQASFENPDIKYFIPKEGATLWTDNFAIPTKSKRIEDAHRFIAYFLEPQNAARIAGTNHLATPNVTARAMLPKEEQENPGLYPSADVMKRLQFMDDIGATLQQINRLWNELKSS